MKELIEILNQGWFGTAVGFAGTIVGIILWYSSKPRPRLAMQTNTLELVGPNAVLPNEIEFLFRGGKVPNVTLSRIAIWNIGNTTIKGEQVVNSDPLRIVVSEGSSILETSILNSTRKVNDVSCGSRREKCNEIECRFDYLDPGDGVLIQLIHTGTDKVKVLGTLRGVPKGIRIFGTPRNETPQKQRQMTPLAANLFAAGILCVGLTMLGSAITGKVNPPEDWLALALLGASLTAISLLVFFGIRYLPPNPLNTQIGSNEPTKSFWQVWIK